MRSQVLAKRNTEGLAASLKSEDEFATVSRELTEFSSLLEENSEFREALLRPFLDTARKMRIVRDILDRQSCHAKTGRFIGLLMENRRLDILAQVVRDLPAQWNERKGVVSYEVRSVVPVKGEQKIKLEEELRKLERRPVSCTYVLDTEIIGGLYIKKGNMVYDVSLKGQLERFKEKIRER